jgi:hypothetical protein
MQTSGPIMKNSDLTQINMLELDSAKFGQQVTESIQNMCGVNQTQQNP